MRSHLFNRKTHITQAAESRSKGMFVLELERNCYYAGLYNKILDDAMSPLSITSLKDRSGKGHTCLSNLYFPAAVLKADQP